TELLTVAGDISASGDFHGLNGTLTLGGNISGSSTSTGSFGTLENAGGMIKLKSGGNTDGWVYSSGYAVGFLDEGGHYTIKAQNNTGIYFATNNGSQKMQILNSGNVSIGNTNDTYKLDVSGTGRFTGNVGLSGAAAQLAIGHVGSSDWDSAMDRIEVGHSMAIFCETADGADRNAFIGNNLYYDGDLKRRYNDQTSHMLFRAGYISFRTDGAATEDVAFTPTERMKIAESGAITMTSTLGVTGAITGGGYSGGAISGTTGTFTGDVTIDESFTLGDGRPIEHHGQYYGTFASGAKYMRVGTMEADGTYQSGTIKGTVTSQRKYKMENTYDFELRWNMAAAGVNDAHFKYDSSSGGSSLYAYLTRDDSTGLTVDIYVYGAQPYEFLSVNVVSMGYAPSTWSMPSGDGELETSPT
ncbi:MAG: hypothetical protein QF535_14660, partial [Anaerolineales bacterium]|nr:hypothetical protein [Anaerolineales bacterium]